MITDEKLTLALELLSEVENAEQPAPNETWYPRYFRLTGEHRILTEEGWQPGEVKASVLADWGEEAVLDEVNAPASAILDKPAN